MKRYDASIWRSTAIIVVLVLPACSYRQLYDAAREAVQIECNKQAGTSPKDCSEKTGNSYDAYTQKRNETLGATPVQ